ncbi:hypothetical protein RHGRI_003834 [Rhododendron griersonianum]|uniref:Uncharacterized protein n=1 Tax=Rhododendron griersonianum TaxID=479676 RepID=A0AAV6L6F0_9ERIC|nr:hypothetical protein RHGRI_003834 [Rhododendron griersonianum]
MGPRKLFVGLQVLLIISIILLAFEVAARELVQQYPSPLNPYDHKMERELAGSGALDNPRPVNG